MSHALHATADFEPETNQWWAACNDCGWIAYFSGSGPATDAADWHDVEYHDALKANA